MKPLILFAVLAPVALVAPARADKVAVPTAAAPKADASKTPAAAPGTEGETPAGMPQHSHTAEEEGGEPFGPHESNSEYFWRRSDKAFHDGDYEHAVAIHRAIVALDPTDTESFGVAAWLLWSMGKIEESNAHLNRGLALNPQNPDMWNEAAQQYDLQKKLPQARDAYANALKYSPPGENTMMLRRRLAHAAEKAGDKTLALETWRGLVKEFPADPVNKNNLARVEKINVAVPFTDNSVLSQLEIAKQPNSPGRYFRVGATVGF